MTVKSDPIQTSLFPTAIRPSSKKVLNTTSTQKRNWIQNLALEAETAISQLPTNEREVYRELVADRINYNGNTTPTPHTKHTRKLN